MGDVRGQVDRALHDVPEDWRTELAQTLAAAMDEDPNASMARELRALMREIEEGVPADDSNIEDDLRARREARLAAAENQERAGGGD